MHQTFSTETGRLTLRNPIHYARQRSADHPMALFAALAGAAMLAFALSPQTAAFAAEERVATAETQGSDVEPACAGQAWGEESESCLLALTRDGSGAPRARIRVIAIR